LNFSLDAPSIVMVGYKYIHFWNMWASRFKNAISPMYVVI